MRIREVAAAAGVSVETIRFYERAGVLPAASRNAAGHRIFGPIEQRMLVIIGWAQGMGYSLSEIANFVHKTRSMPLAQRQSLLLEEVQRRKQFVQAEHERLRILESDLTLLERTPLDDGVWIPAAFVDHLIVRLGLKDAVPAKNGSKLEGPNSPSAPSSRVKVVGARKKSSSAKS